jgi:hypothetical protein
LSTIYDTMLGTCALSGLVDGQHRARVGQRVERQAAYPLQ